MNVVFYLTSSGRSPVVEFLSKLTDRQRAQALDALALLEQFGFDLEDPWLKKIDADLWELRVRADRVRLRFLFSRQGEECVVLHALKKKTDRLPANELKTARQRWREYRESQG